MDVDIEESDAEALAAWNEIWRNAENIMIIIMSSLNIETIDFLAKIIVKGKLRKAKAAQKGRV